MQWQKQQTQFSPCALHVMCLFFGGQAMCVKCACVWRALLQSSRCTRQGLLAGETSCCTLSAKNTPGMH